VLTWWARRVHDGRVTLGGGGPDNRRTQAQVGTAIAGGFVLLVLLAVGLTRMIDGRAASELVAPPSYRAASARTSPARIPPSQPAMAVSFTRNGEIIRAAPVMARIIDTETGEEVLVPLPPGSTVIDGEVVPIGSTGTTRAGGTATTGPGTGTTGTTSHGTSTTANPTTTSPPTTQDTTTTTTEATTTTTTTEATTTTSTTTTTAPAPPPP
jgi:hypothetical protein